MALGIALADTSDASAAFAVLPAAAGILLAFARRFRVYAALPIALAVGFHAQAARLAEARAASAGDAREVLVEGVVARRSAALAPRWIELDEVRGAGIARVRVFSTHPGDLDPWLPGDRLRARLRLAPLRWARNPGDGDPLRRLWRAGLAVGGALPHPSLAAARGESGLRARLHRMRARIAAELMAGGGAGAGLLRGLALGDADALAPAEREVFHRLGLEHALSVSGLHLAWVSAALYAGARALLRRSAWLAARCDTRRVALAPACAGVLAYAALAGWTVPVRRSLLVVLAAGLAVAQRRPQIAGASLAAAALWILADEPDALFQPGAQLSFAAMAAFVWALDRPASLAQRAQVSRSEPKASEDHRVGERRPSVASFAQRAEGERRPSVASFAQRAEGERRPSGGRERRIAAALRTSATAIAATAPIVAWHGGGVSSAAVAANAIALPWLECAVLPAALAAAIAAAAQGPGADAVVRAAGALAAATVDALGAVARDLPALDGAASSWPWWSASLALAAVGLSARSTALRVGAALALAGLLAVAPPAPVSPAPPRLAVLDVGQGDSALVQGGRGAVLVDGGPAHDDFDAGARRVVPALRALGVARLDLVVATHADLDHRGGIPAVLRGIAVGELWLPWGALEDPGFADVLAAARDAGTRVREAGRGSPRRAIGELIVDPLWPPRRGPGSRNERSLVVRISVPDGPRVLLPGDLDARAEAQLLAAEADPRADVLLLPHHGSRGSSSAAFLDAVAPRLAIASAPCRSRFGMPHPEVRARLAERAVPLAWTGRDGAILVRLRGAPAPRGTGEPVRCP
jgi:competence protein ComEC